MSLLLLTFSLNHLIRIQLVFQVPVHGNFISTPIRKNLVMILPIKDLVRNQFAINFFFISNYLNERTIEADTLTFII